MPKRISIGKRHSIHTLAVEGWPKKKISRELKIDRKVVARWFNDTTYIDKPRNYLLTSDRLKRKLRLSLEKRSSMAKTAKNFSISVNHVWKSVRKSKNNPQGVFCVQSETQTQ